VPPIAPSEQTKEKPRPNSVSNPVSDGRGWHIIDFEFLRRPPEFLAAFVYVLAFILFAVVATFVAVGIVAAVKISMVAAFGDDATRVEAAKVFFPVVLTLVGGPFLIWRVITAHLSAVAARDQAQIGRESHYTTLFTKAVEQLGATREVKEQLADQVGSRTEPNLEVRLGAIYALERIAAYSERDHWPIMEVLSAYLRNIQNTGKSIPRPSESKKLGEWIDEVVLSGPRVDVQAALTVMCRRSELRIEQERKKAENLDFSRANLQNARAARGSLIGAHFRGAALDLASFSETNLEKVVFDDCNMYTVFFFSSDLTSASFEDCRIERGNFQLCRMSSGIFIEAKLNHVTFEQCDLSNSSFDLAEFSRVVFSRVDLTNVSFSRTKLSQPFQMPTRFHDVSFGLSDGSFSHFHDAEVFECDFSACRDLTDLDFATAWGDGSTRLPPHIERPTWWPTQALAPPDRFSWVYDQRQKLKGVFGGSSHAVALRKQQG
jgi:uncharacterized protein YjbI with pentapeptide repeats